MKGADYGLCHHCMQFVSFQNALAIICKDEKWLFLQYYQTVMYDNIDLSEPMTGKWSAVEFVYSEKRARMNRKVYDIYALVQGDDGR